MAWGGIGRRAGENPFMAPVKKPPHARRKTFLRAWRLHRQLSLEAAAERVGVDHSTLQRVEVGKVPYGQDLLEKLALVYACETTDLISVGPVEKDILAPLVRQLRRAEPDTQRQALAVLDAVLKNRP